MKINNNAYGGFIITKNVNNGRPVRYSYREKKENPVLNGWVLLSCDDTQEYVNDTANFMIVGATTIHKLAPAMLEIFDAPYGTDLCWIYKRNKHIGFYDLIGDKEVTVDEILG